MTKRERIDWLRQIDRIHEEERRQHFADSELEIERILKTREKEYREGQ